MKPSRRVKLSKRLSYHLRHDPAAAGVELDAQGWTDVDELLAGLGDVGREALEEVVARSEKQRFELSEDRRRIRARYGHSVRVDPAHDARQPPDVLYHGTSRRHLGTIRQQGLRRMGRQRVHLSERVEEARTVGRRHGDPVVLQVDARRMDADGYAFSEATDGVWLVDEVPPRYLDLTEPSEATI